MLTVLPMCVLPVMAGDWIKMRSNLWDDPKVAKLCDLTDSGEAPIIGGLYWLWSMADQHTEDGFLPGLTLRQIDRKTAIPRFGAALCAVGWLTDDEDGITIVRFTDHNGTSAKKRCQTAKRVAKHEAANAPLTQLPPIPNAPSVSSALAREEKRREEPIQDTAASASAVSAPPKRAARKCPGDFEVTSEMQEFADQQFPAVNWRLETEKLRDHTFKNPIADWQGAWRNWIRRSAEDAPKSRDSPALSFRERDELNAIARVHEMTGGLVSAKPSTPRRPDALQEVFDAQTAARRNDRLAVRTASSPVRLIVVEQVGGD